MRNHPRKASSPTVQCPRLRARGWMRGRNLMHDGMRWGRASVAALLMVALGMSSAAAQPARPRSRRVPLPLWPERRAARAGHCRRGCADADAVLPGEPAPTGTAVIVCPGGSYMRLAMDHEGKQVAEWMNMIGVTAFVLEVPARAEIPSPCHADGRTARDPLRAFARAGAEARRGAGRDHGVLGGRNLASTAGTFLDDPTPASVKRDEIDRGNSRPIS